MGQVASELLAVGLHEESTAELPPLNWARKDMGFKIDLEDKDALWRILDREDIEGGGG